MKRIILALFLLASVSAQATRDNFGPINGQDYYEFMGVEPGASPADIQKAYRKLMKLYHPDAGEEKSVEMTKFLNEANDVLSDADTRKRYDSWRNGGSSFAYDFAPDDVSEADRRETELHKNATYVINEANQMRQKDPYTTPEQMTEHGRFFLVYAVRYMPGTDYKTEELWRLITEFAQKRYEMGHIGADSFVALAGGALHYLIERAQYGGYGDERSYLPRIEAILKTNLERWRHDGLARKPWDALWKIMHRQSYYQRPPVQAQPSNCQSDLTSSTRVVQDGVEYIIPITVSVTLGK